MKTYRFDGLGSVMQVTDGSQNIVASYKYDAWGNDLTDPQSPIPNPFRYVGGLGYYSDKDSGLKLLGVRYYYTGLGRFWSVDPIKDGVNWYAYVGNNPANFVDPSGLFWIIDCFRCFYYWNKCWDWVRQCQRTYPDDTQARWRCMIQDPNCRKMFYYCYKCGWGSYKPPINPPSPRLASYL